jgi:hypothetical protein
LRVLPGAVFPHTFYAKNGMLPRQARDKHRGTPKNTVFSRAAINPSSTKYKTKDGWATSGRMAVHSSTAMAAR